MLRADRVESAVFLSQRSCLANSTGALGELSRPSIHFGELLNMYGLLLLRADSEARRVESAFSF